jgi:hypothetical protein
VRLELVELDEGAGIDEARYPLTSGQLACFVLPPDPLLAASPLGLGIETVEQRTLRIGVERLVHPSGLGCPPQKGERAR